MFYTRSKHCGTNLSLVDYETEGSLAERVQSSFSLFATQIQPLTTSPIALFVSVCMSRVWTSPSFQSEMCSESRALQLSVSFIVGFCEQTPKS